MNTIFVVMEKSPNGTRVSKVFENNIDAIRYRIECIGDHEFYDFNSSYQYWIEEWEVA